MVDYFSFPVYLDRTTPVSCRQDSTFAKLWWTSRTMQLFLKLQNKEGVCKFNCTRLLEEVNLPDDYRAALLELALHALQYSLTFLFLA
jgi:hypothetical protein